MLQKPSSPALCCKTAGQTLPRSIEALRESAEITELGQEFENLALVGTQFEDALITTQNGTALLATRGGYAAVQRSDMPLRLTRAAHRSDIRFAPDHPTRLARSAAESGTPLATVIAFDSHGQVQHRVQLATDYDQGILTALSPAPFSAPEPHGIVMADNVIPLMAVRAARADWDDLDVGHHLNHFLRDRGRDRARCLPHMSRERAWEILPDVLPSFLTYLCNRQIGLSRIVPCEGLMQADLGRFDTVDLLDRVFWAQAGANSFSLDMKAVGAAWVTVLGWVWQIEIFDKTGRGGAILAGDPIENQQTWRDLLCSLPREVRLHRG